MTPASLAYRTETSGSKYDAKKAGRFTSHHALVVAAAAGDPDAKAALKLAAEEKAARAVPPTIAECKARTDPGMAEALRFALALAGAPVEITVPEKSQRRDDVSDGVDHDLDDEDLDDSDLDNLDEEDPDAEDLDADGKPLYPRPGNLPFAWAGEFDFGANRRQTPRIDPVDPIEAMGQDDRVDGFSVFTPLDWTSAPVETYRGEMWDIDQDVVHIYLRDPGVEDAEHPERQVCRELDGVTYVIHGAADEILFSYSN